MGGVTTSGYPYVTPTDHPKEFPAHSQALANKLETDGTWTAYVPTLTGCSASAVVAKYARAGNVITVAVKLTLTSVSDNITVSTPFTADGNNIGSGLGIARMLAGAGVYFGMVLMAGSTSMRVQLHGTNGVAVNITSTVPATWVNGNSCMFIVTYQAA